MAIAKAVPEMSSGRIFKEWKSVSAASLLPLGVLETKKARICRNNLRSLQFSTSLNLL
jgi:hypothetical protein